jgi:hypothetical protein
MHDLEDRLRAALAKHAGDADETPAGANLPPRRAGGGARKVLAALVALAFAGGVLAAGLWVAGRGDSEPTPAEEPEREVIREDPEALVCDEAPGNPEPAARHAWPLTFAGLWIDEKERMLYAAFTERAEEKAAKLAECFPKRSFTPVTFEHSDRELVQQVNKISGDRKRIEDGTLNVPGIPNARFHIYIHTMYNVVVVVMEEATPEAIAAFTTRYGGHVVVTGRGYFPGPGGPELPPEDIEGLDCERVEGTVEETIRESWPLTFAGLWLDGGTFFVAFTEGAEEKTVQLRACFPERRFSPVTFEHSLDRLEGLLGRIAFERELVRAGRLTLRGVPDHRFDLMIDERTNTIRVIMEEPTPEAAATFARRYGDHVIVEQGDLGVPEG